MSGRTAIIAIFLALTLSIGSTSFSRAMSPDGTIHPIDPTGPRAEAGAAPSDAGDVTFFLPDIAGEFAPVFRNILNARFLDAPDFGPPVPDPNALAIFGIGLIALGFLRRLIA